MVTAVIAHTLPEPGASNRVLEKAGLSFVAEVEEDGATVWRYAYSRNPTASRAAAGSR